MPLQVAMDHLLAAGGASHLRSLAALEVLPEMVRPIEARAAGVAEELGTAAAGELLGSPLHIQGLIGPGRVRKELLVAELVAQTQEIRDLLRWPELPGVRWQGLLDGSLDLRPAVEAAHQLQVVPA